MSTYTNTLCAAGLVSPPGSAERALQGLVVQLYTENSTGLFRYALTITRDRRVAEDAIQDCFLRFFVALKNNQLIHNPRAWLYRVLRNLLLNETQRSSSRSSTGIEAAIEKPDWRRNPEAFLWRKEVTQGVRAALSPRELECLQLRLEGLDYKEISTTLRIRPGTVGALLARAVKKTQTALGRGVDEP
ncbi:MAG: sigma-70 family RNA polymerase sigma factor [Acidobacteriales bacterium]|nr:MAG: sigma-70 family RNA polymerase sigma factor [Terriglobales bacterium]